MTADIVVVGGGPAGATCARRLAERGHRVRLVVGRSRPRDDVEVLKPATVERLRRAGLADVVGHSGRPLAGVEGAWGADGAFDAPAILDPYGAGWVVDRTTFDAGLLQAAVGAGVDAIDASAIACDMTAGQRWRVTVGRGAPLTGTWLVDATGRAAWAARRHGHRDVRRLTATGRRFHGGDGRATLCIETVTDGWWYSVPRPDGDLVVVHVGTGVISETAWPACLRRAPRTAARVHGCHPAGPRWVRPAGPARTTGGPSSLVAVGDAMVAFDPVTGDGLSFAVVSGDEAALAIDRAATDPASVVRYRLGAHRLDEHYEHRRRALYADAGAPVTS